GHVPVHLTPVAKRSDRARQLGVVRHDRTALAVGAQVLSRVEAEAAEVAERADTAALVLRTVRLARVLDHLQAVPGGDLQEGAHVGRLAVEVDPDDGTRLPRDP